MTKGVRLWIQVAEMGFIRRVADVSLEDKVRSSVVCEELGVELLLLSVERSQLRWFGHLVRMPPGHLPKRGVPGTSSWKEEPGQTQVQVERLYLCTDP